ncbi:hypothetical protein F4W67_09285 [Pseudomonas caricapapayae]|nr:hypothetical protein F4W67_09285 [Pseudomonas caricapapayae]
MMAFFLKALTCKGFRQGDTKRLLLKKVKMPLLKKVGFFSQKNWTSVHSLKHDVYLTSQCWQSVSDRRTGRVTAVRYTTVTMTSLLQRCAGTPTCRVSIVHGCNDSPVHRTPVRLRDC